jgi:predicted TIM-barrel fold metal-dependent hydrolase
MIVSDRARGIQPPPTLFGQTALLREEAALTPWGAVEHLASLILQGVLERRPDLVVVFGDGGFDTFIPLLWRLNRDRRGLRYEVPWVLKPPIEYVDGQLRFVLHPADGPTDVARAAEIVKSFHVGDSLTYGSRYTYWDYWPVASARRGVPQELQPSVLSGTFERPTARIAFTGPVGEAVAR